MIFGEVQRKIGKVMAARNNGAGTSSAKTVFLIMCL
jgi:hypothetical protein